MSNVHMQAAATSLNQAVNDLSLLEQQVRADTNTKRQEYEQRLNQIRVEKRELGAFRSQAPDDVTRQQYQQSIDQLDAEYRDIEKQIADVQQRMEQQVRDIDQQRTEVSQMAGKLANMA